jgi:hypothetical protein
MKLVNYFAKLSVDFNKTEQQIYNGMFFFCFSFKFLSFLHSYYPSFFSVPFLLYAYFPMSFAPFLEPFTECDTSRVGRPVSYVCTFDSLRFLGVLL